MALQVGGMDVPDARRLGELEGENAKLKELLAECGLDMHAFESVLEVKRWCSVRFFR